MAYILIDGYNLIGIAHNNLENARNNLIEQLQRYSELKGHGVTVVFDGWKSGQLNETKTRIGNVNIIFSRLGEKADILIKRILSEKQGQWIAVSSDREIADFANKKGFASITAEEFERKLYPVRKKAPPFTENKQNIVAQREFKTTHKFSNGVYSTKHALEETAVEPTDMKDDDIYSVSAKRKGNPRKPSKKQKQKLRALKKL
ncbi:MAG: NYN domain-containing protein [Nitrospirae bacterium]|nr:NYN domain-containing protein [Nitrospirota bacterium]